MLDKRSNLLLACTLSALAGYVDGIGFVHLGGLFVSFMSGNSTRLGVSIADSDWSKAREATFLIAIFVLGAALGSLIMRGGRERQALLLVTEAALLALAAATRHIEWHMVPVALIVIAMGLENTVFQIAGGSGIGLTYMTGALVKVGQGLAIAIGGGARWTWAPHLALWAALVTGAVIGTLAYDRLNLGAIWFAAIAALAVGGVLALSSRRPAR